jgi:hypothetical protein
MAVTKISLEGAGASFKEAQSFLIKARNDPNDPVSWNLAQALDSHFHAIGTAQKAIADGINTLLECVDRIQTKLDQQRR